MNTAIINEDTTRERHDFWMKRVEERAAVPGASKNMLEINQPHIAIKALMMLEERIAARDIMKELGCNWQIVNALRVRHSDTIQERRKEFSRNFASVAYQGMEAMAKKFDRMMEDDDLLDKASLKDIAIATGIATDKGMALDGMATVTIEHRRGPSIDDAAKMIAEARARIAASSTTLEAEIVT